MSRADDLTRARAKAEDVRAGIYEAVSGKSDAELLCPPADGGWSAAEVLDHIGTAERTLVKALAKIEKGEVGFEELEAYTLKNGEPVIGSGRQEMLENLINEFI